MKFKQIAAVLLGSCVAVSAFAQSVGVGTTPQGSMNYSLGSAVAKLITEKLNVQARVQPNSGDSVLLPLVNSGELTYGVTNIPEALDAASGVGPYKGHKNAELRLVSILIPVKTSYFVKEDSPIKTLGELKGKRITYGYTAQPAFKPILDALLANGGLTPEDIEPALVPNLVRGAEEFAGGNVDSFFFSVGAGKVTEVDATVGGLRMLPVSTEPAAVEAMKKIYPFGYVAEIAPRPGLAGVAQPTPTLAMDLALFVSATESEDNVYKVVKSLAENKADLAATFPPLNEFNVNQMYKDLPMAYHPGAVRYYKERGFIK
ncbi:MAG: TAXI family TRAP transporter solute-binding subunit [Pusillimonas sp.]|nr:TAXI family TRAP transporter solute-binding subunit [Pusillimonas sp.]